MPAATPLNTNWSARQSMIDMLRKQRGNRDSPQGQMVDGWYVPPAWSQQLNYSLGPILDALRLKQAGKQEQQLNADMTQDMQNWMNQRPVAGLDPNTTPLPAPGEAQNITQPTQQEQLAWAQRGAANPLTKALAAELTKDIAISQPKEQRKQTFDYNQLTRRLEQADQHLALRMQDSQLNRDQRAALQTQRLQVQQQLAAASNAARIQAAQLGRSNINIKIGNEDIRTLEDAASEREGMTEAIDSLKDSNTGNWATSGVGAWATGALLGGSPAKQTVLRSLRDSTYNDAVQSLNFWQQQYLHSQFGTQLTKAELAEFAKVAPSPTDSKAEVIRKGEAFIRLRDQQISRLRDRVQGAADTGTQNLALQPTSELPPPMPQQPPAFNIQGLFDTVQGAEGAAQNAMGGAQLPQVPGLQQQPRIRRWNPQTGSFE